MSDVFDQAQNLEEQHRSKAIAAITNRTEPKAIDIDGHRYCIDCDAEINKKRIASIPNATRCIECQTLKEIKDKQLRG